MDTREDMFKGFGYRELDLAGDLLKAYADNPSNVEIDQDTMWVDFNPNSGFVYLTDAEGNCVMLNGDKLENWITKENGDEGFASEIEADND